MRHAAAIDVAACRGAGLILSHEGGEGAGRRCAAIAIHLAQSVCAGAVFPA